MILALAPTKDTLRPRHGGTDELTRIYFTPQKTRLANAERVF